MGLDNLKLAEKLSNDRFVERKEEIHALTLATLTGTPILLLGAPGVGKSAIANTWTSLISGANIFEWLLTKFTLPDELFGPISIKSLEKDEYCRNMLGKLPMAHIVFLDEIFKANSAILNALLAILNEKIFHNNGKIIKIPLMTLIGASNELPEEGDSLEPVTDRFILKFHVKAIQESSNFKKLLDIDMSPMKPVVSLDEIYQMQKEVAQVKVPEGIKIMFTELRSLLKNLKISASDRAYIQTYKILKAEAYYHGRDTVVESDLDVMQHTLWTKPEEKKIIYSTILNSINPELREAAEVFDRATELYDTILKEVSDRNITDKKKTAGGVEAVVKLKTAKTDLAKLKDQMHRKNKDLSPILVMEKKVEDYLHAVYSQACGVEF